MKINSLSSMALMAAVSATCAAFAGTALAQQPRILKMQSAAPSSTTHDAFRFFADRWTS